MKSVSRPLATRVCMGVGAERWLGSLGVTARLLRLDAVQAQRSVP